jgi:hypothetical protein
LIVVSSRSNEAKFLDLAKNHLFNEIEGWSESGIVDFSFDAMTATRLAFANTYEKDFDSRFDDSIGYSNEQLRHDERLWPRCAKSWQRYLKLSFPRCQLITSRIFQDPEP